ncbi:MAG: chemotaxis protein CheC [Bacteroidales bacterium]|nr:chemotaxis protein CheC [Bacteroidales bacterium]
MKNLSKKHISLITELVNIGIGKSTNMLNQLLESQVNITSPTIKLLNDKQLPNILNYSNTDKISTVNLKFANDIQGCVKLVFPYESALKLVHLFLENARIGASTEMFDSLKTSALIEIGNIVLSSLIGSISNEMNLQIHYSVPDYNEGTVANTILQEKSCVKRVLLYCATTFSDDNIDVSGNIIIFFDFDKFNEFIKSMDSHYNIIGV